MIDLFSEGSRHVDGLRHPKLASDGTSHDDSSIESRGAYP